MKHLALILLIASGSVSAADTEPQAISSANWPAYRCHAEQEGRGRALKGTAPERLQATEKMPAAEAIAALEALLADLDPASGSRHWVTATLAWRYQDAERRDDLRAAALRTISDPYVVGQTADSMWALAAQSYADEGNWLQVRSLLEPMVDMGCRPVTDPVRRLLAVAFIKTEDYVAALEQCDRICMVDEPEQLSWMRTALEVDCRLHGAQACVDRIVRYAKGAAPSEALQQMLNTALAQLAADASNGALLDQWSAQGLLTADYQGRLSGDREGAADGRGAQTEGLHPAAVSEAGAGEWAKRFRQADADGGHRRPRARREGRRRIAARSFRGLSDGSREERALSSARRRWKAATDSG